MTSVVTIAIPVYRRLHYLPEVLASVRAQDYPAIDLLISDNGVNGERVPQVVREHYDRPFRFRQNPATVNIAQHFNQCIAEARGEYFVLLADDDTISPNFVSAAHRRIHGDPQVGAVLARTTTMDEAGRPLPEPGLPPPPAAMTALEFARAWGESRHSFVSFATMLARTADIRAAGSFLDLPSGNCIDNVLLLKLVLGRSLAYCAEAEFCHRIHETSAGLAASAGVLAQATRMVLEELDRDPDLRRFAAARPAEWAEIKRWAARVHWYTYMSRWQTMYRGRMPYGEWVRAAFAMPWIPEYYNQVTRTLAYSVPPLAALLTLVRRARTAA